METLEHVYYFPIDGQGNEVGEPVKIGLNADGSADLSGLPKEMRETYEAWGVPDELHNNRIFLKQGEQFLMALLRMTNGYVRFRSEKS